MAESTRCPECRHPVDVPDDHRERLIHCGICWAEVDLGERAAPVELIAVADVPVAEPSRVNSKAVAPPSKPAGKIDPLAHVPGFPVKGMAPLEEVLRRVVERMPALIRDGTAKPERAESTIIPADLLAQLPPVPAAAAPRLPDVLSNPKPRADAKRDDDDLRRPRRPAVNPRIVQNEDEEPNAPPAQTGAGRQILTLVICVAVAVGTFLLLRSLMK
jgi:hypothetical protein